ncbi:GNAT family N-acetyltransferase [Pseudolysinimonas kribbensis]|uniref:GNAT family N-acetyltransferase n=1 Tax=Pseudolysinimonas kribbensis TaxID=433641 RepID=UPI0024E08DE6|nr:GNAT family N-acetyltransferase [Pseudolysinimonas kribbensis]
MSTPVLRPIEAGDIAALVALNTDAAPAVNVVSVDEFTRLADDSTLALAVDDGEPAGLLLALPPGLDYASENYRWFSERASAAGTDFLYVDRIVVAPRLRGTGVGRRLYETVFATAAVRGVAEVLCEVNLQPPNPGSMRFHLGLGFAEVGRQHTKGGAVEVALLARATAAATSA